MTSQGLSTNPVFVENVRGSLVENFHRGAAAVVDYRGKLLASWGNIQRPVYARSSIKYLQTIPLIESGAAKAFGLGAKEIALACASHVGEGEHVEGVAQWLGAIGLHQGVLKCGRCRPSHGPSYKDLIRAGQEYTQLHNPCSGKHTGFLTIAQHQGYSIDSYLDSEHPIQVQIQNLLEELMQVDMSRLPHGLDGCGIPAYAFPLYNMALGMTRLSPLAVGLSPAHKEALSQIREALTEFPQMVAGSNRLDTVLMHVTRGQVLSKVGADGVYGVCLPQKGIGIALKIDDGTPKAAEIAMGTLISHFYDFTHSQLARLKPFFEPVIHNIAKCDTGFYRSHQAWLSLRS